MERGYEENILKNQIDKVDNTDRKSLLRKKKKKKSHTNKNGKAFKTHSENRKENVNLATQVNYHYVASGILTPIDFKVTKRSNYTSYS